jgi:hypothetical protein
MPTPKHFASVNYNLWSDKDIARGLQEMGALSQEGWVRVATLVSGTADRIVHHVFERDIEPPIPDRGGL